MISLDKVYRPFDKQLQFHKAAATQGIRYVCFWGALDSGKTWAGAAEACRQAYNRPGGTGLVVRTTYRELQDSTAKQLREDFLQPLGMEIKYVKRDEEIFVRAKGGGTHVIKLRSLDHVEKFRSAQFDWIWLDEASDPKIKENDFNLIRGRMRDSENPVFLLTTNPPFVGQWLFNYFNQPKAGSQFYTIFVQTFDNPYHDKEYVADLLESYPQDWVEVYLMGKAGAILAGRPVYRGSFDREKNIRPFTFSPGLELIRAWDFGVTRSAVVWAQIETINADSDAFLHKAVEHLVFIDEAIYENVGADDMARMVKARTTRKFPGLAPTSIRDACDIAGTQRSQATTQTAVGELNKEGIYPTYQLIQNKEAAIFDFSKNLRITSHGIPLILFTDNCSLLTMAIDAGYHRDQSGEIVADGLYCHVADAALYAHLNFFTAPHFQVNRPRPPKAARAVYDFMAQPKRRGGIARYKFGDR